MKVATQKRTTVLRKQATDIFRRQSAKSAHNVSPNNQNPDQASGTHSLSDGLAICLFGFTRSMYVSEDEEEVRKRVIMSEVLPDEVMWAAWAKNEAPLRQGRGWYPALDRHFLELLVISEIHCLANPLTGISAVPGQAERIHRHATRVRRVACERIGAERLHAYCDRVKEAFEAYMHGAWGAAVRQYGEDLDAASDDDEDANGSAASSESSEEEESRGRPRNKGEGSVRREEGKKPPEDGDAGNLKRSPTIRSIHESDTPMHTEGDVLEDADLMKIDLADVDEEDGRSIPENDVETRTSAADQDGMQIDSSPPSYRQPSGTNGVQGSPDLGLAEDATGRA